MRFTFLTPGTGNFFCGSCLRDHSMARALRMHGHTVSVVPLYLPHVVEEDEALRVGDVPDQDKDSAVQMGGINMYLQHISPKLFGLMPGWLRKRLDAPALLRWVSKRSGMTDASGLGAMTLSMLRGEGGKQAAELERLVGWLRGDGERDVVVLSNAMLTGTIRRLRKQLGCPVVVTLQGEQPFLDALPEPYRSQAWSELAERLREADLLVAVSETYGALMRERLGLDEARVVTIHNGIDLAGFDERPRPLAERGSAPTVGYLARMCEDKGLPVLVDAFVELCERGRVSDVRLVVVGVVLGEDRAMLRDLQRRLARAGLSDRVRFFENVDRKTKLDLLRTMRVLSVPALYGESFGLYLLEALASGVPFVQPRHGAFAEIAEATGGGLIVDPDDASALADGLESVLTDPERAQALADAGHRAVRDRFHNGHMAEAFVAECATRFGTAPADA